MSKHNRQREQCREYGCGALLVTGDELAERLCERHILIRDWQAMRPPFYSDEFRAAARRQAEAERQRQRGA